MTFRSSPETIHAAVVAAAQRAVAAGRLVVMDHCPGIEFPRLAA